MSEKNGYGGDKCLWNLINQSRVRDIYYQLLKRSLCTEEKWMKMTNQRGEFTSVREECSITLLAASILTDEIARDTFSQKAAIFTRSP